MKTKTFVIFLAVIAAGLWVLQNIQPVAEASAEDSMAMPVMAEAAADDVAFSDAERAEIGAIIREYILENPELLFEASEIYQQRQEEEQNEAARATISEMMDELFENPLSPVGGNPDGDVRIVEFYDYNCPYCKRSHEAVSQVLEEDGNIRFIFKQFPILGPESEFAARVALAADMQGLYEPVHTRLIETEGRLSEDAILDIAREEGLDMEQLAEDVESERISGIIESNRAAATRIGITGTPGYLFETEIVRGVISPAQMHAIISDLRGETEEKVVE